MVVGSYFVKDGDGFIRINVGCPRETLKEALNRIKNVYRYVLLNYKKVSMVYIKTHYLVIKYYWNFVFQ